jgi:hypothetical protein
LHICFDDEANGFLPRWDAALQNRTTAGRDAAALAVGVDVGAADFRAKVRLNTLLIAGQIVEAIARFGIHARGRRSMTMKFVGFGARRSLDPFPTAAAPPARATLPIHRRGLGWRNFRFIRQGGFCANFQLG